MSSPQSQPHALDPDRDRDPHLYPRALSNKDAPQTSGPNPHPDLTMT